MNRRLFILLAFLIILTNCHNNHTDKKQTTELMLPELIRTAYESRDAQIFPQLCRSLNDSISGNIFFWVHIITEINEQARTVNWEIVVEHDPPPEVTNRLLFNVCITNSDSILIMNKTGRIEEIKMLANEYIFNPDSIDSPIVIGTYHTDSWGEVEISRVGTTLSFCVKNEKEYSIDNWTLFFQCLHELLCVFEDKQNEVSANKWGKDFNSLNFEQKVAVTEIINYRISLFFD